MSHLPGKQNKAYMESFFLKRMAGDTWRACLVFLNPDTYIEYIYLLAFVGNSSASVLGTLSDIDR